MGEWEWSDVMQAWAKIVKVGDKEAGALIQQRPDGWYILSDQELPLYGSGPYETLEIAKERADKALQEYLAAEQ